MLYSIIKNSALTVLANDKGRPVVVDAIDVNDRDEAMEYAALMADEHARRCFTVAVPLADYYYPTRKSPLGWTFNTSNGTRITYSVWDAS